jgi:putative restriction endonuclease
MRRERRRAGACGPARVAAGLSAHGPDRDPYPWGPWPRVAERLTADEYLAREDPRRTELVDGILVVNKATVLHQRVVGLTYAALLAWTQAAPERGTVSLPLDVRLDDATVLAPDLLWFAGESDLSAARAPRMPELAVEVRSPATWVYDGGQKRDLYEHHGLRSCGWPTPPAARCSSTAATRNRAVSTCRWS